MRASVPSILRVRVLSLPLALIAAACAPPPAASPPVASPPSPAPVAAVSSAPVASAAPASSTPAPQETPVDPVVEALSSAVLAGHGATDAVASLTTEVGARLAGSPGDKLAVAWALKTMHDRGLANVHAEPVKVPVWQRGVETASIVAPVPHKLAVVALGWSGATPAKGIEADVVKLDSLDALKASDAKTLSGKIVFLDVRMRDAGEMSDYGNAVGARGSGPLEAQKKGALAIVIRSIGTDASRFPHTGATHVRNSEDEKTRDKTGKTALPAGALSNADADLLERTLATHGSARLALNLGPRWLPDADSANVVGEIVGTEKPNEVVLLGAHLDSWDLGEGAIDDGAGCGIVLEAGRAIAAMPQKPHRTVRVVLFAAEENSLAGGKAYGKAHAAEAGSIVAAMEADSGTGRVKRAAFLGAAEARERFAALAPILRPLSVTVADGPAHGGADISPLRALGVPLVDLTQNPERYFDTHHTANDTFARIDSTALTQAAAAFATTSWAIAEMKGDLGRIPEAEREHEH